MALSEQYLTPEMMNEVDIAFQEIYTSLLSAGYDIPQIQAANYVYWYTLPTLLLDLFNQNETNTQAIDEIVDWVNPYSTVFKWGKKNGAIFNGVNRWFSWIDFNRKIINNQHEKPRYLVDNLKNQIYDSSGEPILTLEGYFNE